jgi:hypothetical protein
MPAASPSIPSRKLKEKTRAVMLLAARERALVVVAFVALLKCIHAVHRGQVWAISEHLGYLIEALARMKRMNLQDARGANLLSKHEETVAVELVS